MRLVEPMTPQMGEQPTKQTRGKSIDPLVNNMHLRALVPSEIRHCRCNALSYYSSWTCKGQSFNADRNKYSQMISDDVQLWKFGLHMIAIHFSRSLIKHFESCNHWNLLQRIDSVHCLARHKFNPVYVTEYNAISKHLYWLTLYLYIDPASPFQSSSFLPSHSLNIQDNVLYAACTLAALDSGHFYRPSDHNWWCSFSL